MEAFFSLLLSCLGVFFEEIQYYLYNLGKWNVPKAVTQLSNKLFSHLQTSPDSLGHSRL